MDAKQLGKSIARIAATELPDVITVVPFCALVELGDDRVGLETRDGMFQVPSKYGELVRNIFCHFQDSTSLTSFPAANQDISLTEIHFFIRYLLAIGALMAKPSVNVFNTRIGVFFIGSPIREEEALVDYLNKCSPEEFSFFSTDQVADTQAEIQVYHISHLDPVLPKVSQAHTATGKPAVLCRFHRDSFRIGPMYVPGMSPCFECYQWRYINTVSLQSDDTVESTTISPSVVSPIVLQNFAADLLAEVERLGAGERSPRTLSAQVTFSMVTGERERTTILRSPMCKNCIGSVKIGS